MDSSSLNSEILKWVRTAKIFTYVYLGEKSVAGKVFGASRAVSQTYFIEASQTWIFPHLNFGTALAIRNHSPEKILLLMYMYDAHLNLMPVIDVLFSDEAGSDVRNEAHGVLSGLGESVMRTLDQFRNVVKTNVSSIQFTEGGVHHLTMYVMKYLKTLAYYSDILNFVLHEGRDDHLHSSLNMNTAIEVDGKCSCCSISPVSQWLQSTVSILESNLKRKSLVYYYKNVSLQHLFLMNNLWHMVQQMKDSELEPLLGESWMRKQDGKPLQHAFNYEGNSWGRVLSLLRVEGTGRVSTAVLKDKILGFNLAFEDICRSQRMWLIGDAQLQDFLRTSISSNVLPAYNSFLARFSSRVKRRYIKYSAEDLAESILDLFEGSPKPLHRSHRR